MEFLEQAGLVFAYLAAVSLCLSGVVLAALSFSGTWLVFLAALLCSWLRWPDFPGIITLSVFFLLCLLCEGLEFMAGKWGVEKFGGSKQAGWAALGGTLIGGVLGALLIPVPILGSLSGMLGGAFLAAFLVEYRLVENRKSATRAARGAVWARLSIMLLKLGVTLLISSILLGGMLLT